MKDRRKRRITAALLYVIQKLAAAWANRRVRRERR